MKVFRCTWSRLHKDGTLYTNRTTHKPMRYDECIPAYTRKEALSRFRDNHASELSSIVKVNCEKVG